MSSQRAVLRAVILPVLLLLAIPGFRLTGRASPPESAGYAGVDATRIEKTLKRMDRVLDSFSEAEKPRANITLPRDPFASLYPEEKMPLVDPAVATKPPDEKMPAAAVNISGIVSGRKRLAIIEDEVKAEGDFIGRYQIHKIEPDRVWLKDRDRLFTVEMHK